MKTKRISDHNVSHGQTVWYTCTTARSNKIQLVEATVTRVDPERNHYTVMQKDGSRGHDLDREEFGVTKEEALVNLFLEPTPSRLRAIKADLIT